MCTILENYGEEAPIDSIKQCCHVANCDTEKGMWYYRKHSLECSGITLSFEEEFSEETFEAERGTVVSDSSPKTPIQTH